MDAATIRPMRSDEAPVVARLLLAANEEHLEGFPSDVASAYRAELADVAGRGPRAEVYVAEVAERVIGSVTFFPDAADDGHPWPPGGSVLRLLAVDPGARGRGTGERLAVACVERARSCGARYLGLHTAPTMAVARRMYERLGFERTPEHDFHPRAHYGDGTDADDPPWGLAYVLRFE